MFAALLTACTERVPGSSDGESASTGATDGGTTVDPGATDSNTTDISVTDASATASTGAPPSTTIDHEESSSECVYETHEIALTPAQYQAWLDGTATGTDTTDGGGESTGSGGGEDTGTIGSTAGDDTGAGETAGTGGADPDATGTAGETGGDGWSFELCVEICDALTDASPWDIESCDRTGVDADGNITIECVQIIEHCDGRSHACIASRGAVRADDPVAAHFARAAHDEAASVYAFAALARELARLGAPAHLLARIRAAAADEVRHADAVARLVADRGGACRRPARQPFAERSAREIAVENAVEGCVRETWAALLAAHQARHAADPQVRATMRAIADDEARHAELAWAIDAWLQAALDDDARAEVEAARRTAAAALLAGVAADNPAAALVREAGVPARAAATRLAHGLAAALWAA